MKKALLLLVCAASLTAMQAQVKVGIKGGGNYSNVLGDDGDGGKAKFGFNAGLLAQISLIEGLSIQPEAVYSRQGAKATEAGVPDLIVNLDYVNVPVLAKYTTGGGFFSETGPQIGFLMNAKAHQGGQKADVKEYFKKTDFAWVFGLGYISKAKIGFNIRYNLGLSQLQEDADTKTKNGVFQAGVFYLLGSKK